MTSIDVQAEKATQYQEEYDEIMTDPSPEKLPPFFADSNVIFLAHKNGRYTAHHKSMDGGFTVSRGQEPDSMQMLRLLSDAEQCIGLGMTEAALLLSCSINEAVLRAMNRQSDLGFTHPPMHLELIQEVGHRQLVADSDVRIIEHCSRLRNMAAHGIQPNHIDVETVKLLIDVTRRLIFSVQNVSIPESDERFEQVHYGDGIRKSSQFLLLVGAANNLLQQIMGTSSKNIRVDWDLISNENGRAVAGLRITDSTGSASGTLTPEELKNPVRLRRCLHEVWGDLLQIRSNHQFEAFEKKWYPESE